MLTFFRKHQKAFFIVTAVVIIASFSFFGTYSAFQNPSQERDEILGTAVDGSKLRSLEMQRMIRFLATDRLDDEAKEIPNFYNDGAIRFDLLSSGFAEKLIEARFDHFSEEITEKIERFKTFSPYFHPAYKALSVEGIWSEYMPSIKEGLERFKKEGAVDIKTVSLLIQLYLDQTKFSPHLVRQILWQKQNQLKGLPKDPEIEQGDFSLFHVHTIKDLLGKTFIDFAVQYIYNVALIAKQKGYKVTQSEAKADLYRIGFETLSAKKGKPVDSEELVRHFTSQLKALALTEEDAVRIWQRVLLFRKYVNDVGGSVFLDRITYEAFHAYADQSIDVDLYQIPQELQFSSFMDMLKFQYYLNVTYQMPENSLELPEKMFSLESIEKNAPFLVQRKYHIQMAHVQKEEIALDVSLKETWNWQKNENNWKILQKAFKELEEKSLSEFEKLPEALRQKIDAFSRKKIVDSHPEWIVNALDRADMKDYPLKISLEGGKIPFKGFKDREAFIKLLDTKDESLSLLTFNEEDYYKIVVVENTGEREIVSFKDALEQGFLTETLNQKLKAAYPIVRQNEPVLFQDQEGQWKSFEDVIELVGKFAYADLCKNIEKTYEAQGNKLPLKGSLKQPPSFYMKYRFLKQLEEAKRQLNEKGTLDEEKWPLKKSSLTVKHSEKNAYFSEEAFQMPKNTWSEVLTTSREPYFFYLKEKNLDGAALTKEMELGGALLSSEARLLFMQQLMDQIPFYKKDESSDE